MATVKIDFEGIFEIKLKPLLIINLINSVLKMFERRNRK